MVNSIIVQHADGSIQASIVSCVKNRVHVRSQANECHSAVDVDGERTGRGRALRERGAEQRVVRDDTAQIQADIDRMVATFPRLKERAQQLAGTMSGGEQQMLAMARALMSRPKLLLLDEPSMGLSPIMVEKIFEVIRAVHGQGTTLLLVEQNAKLALMAADRAYVMDSGLITMTDDAKRMLSDPRVRAAYLGEAH